MSGRRIFKDQNKFNEMIQMIEDGLPYTQIAKHFKCDHSSIINWARKLGITPDRKVLNRKIRHPYEPRRDKLPSKPYAILKDAINGERINPGKMSYQEYLDAEKARLKKIKTSAHTEGDSHEGI